MKSTKCGGGYIYSVPMNDIEYIGYFYASKGKEVVKSAYSRIKSIRGSAPDFLFNAELFDFNTRAAASDVVSGGVVHRLTEGYGIAFPNNNKAVFSYKNNVKANDYIGAYPVLIRNGKAESSIPGGIGGVRGRTAIGVDKDNLYIALVPDGSNDVTLNTLRSAFIKEGATEAINLDGGGSTQFYAPNGNFFSGRNVRGFIGVWLKKKANTTPKVDIRTVKVRTFLNVRKQPIVTSTRVGKLYNGNKVIVLEEKKDWCRISTGWVKSAYLYK